MSAGRYDITLEQGATFDLPLTYRDPAGIPVDLTGYSARMQIREAPDSAVLVEFNSALTANGFILLAGSAEDREDGANGNIRILLSSANATALPRFAGRYDLELDDGSGYVIRLLEGQFRVEPEITK
jgi:hypothetical protein